MRLLLPALLLLLGSPVQAAPALDGLYYEQRIGAVLPLAAPFTDERGHAITLGETLGAAPLVIALGYFHCPSLCGIVRADVMQALHGSGLATPGGYRLLAVSIDPTESAADAASAKADDLARFPTPGAAAGWRFLTGPRDSIRLLARAVGFHDRYDSSLKQFIHPAGVVIATADGRVSSYMLGLGYTPDALRGAVQAAWARHLAPVASPVLLLCFHYDASTGRYTLSILRVLRLTCVLFLGAVAATLWVRHRRLAGRTPA